MRVVLLFLTVGLFAARIAGAAGASSPGREAIIDMLTKPNAWVVYIEHAGSATPSAHAGVQRWQFFRRGSDVVGRTLQLTPGLNGEFKVLVRDDGIDVQRCCMYPPNYPMTSVYFDPNDKTYPFKRSNTPQKWWLSPER